MNILNQSIKWLKAQQLQDEHCQSKDTPRSQQIRGQEAKDKAQQRNS